MSLLLTEKTEIVSSIDLPAWLSAQDHFPKMYWKCRKTGVEKALLGSCLEFSTVPRLPKDSPLTLYGALSFPGNSLDKEWEDFPSPFFFLPLVEIEQSKNQTILKRRGPEIKLNTPTPLPDPDPLQFQKHTPSEDLWAQNIEKALQAFQQGFLQKVVFARKSTFKACNSPFSWLKHLVQTQKNTTVFALQIKPSSLFLGASPEMLYQRQGTRLSSESVAGTRKRGSSFLEDIQLANELKESLKDQKEFSHVKKYILDCFSSLCKEYLAEENSLVQTTTLQHLYSKIEGILHPEITDSDILSKLHPTPAVCGLPLSVAKKTIESSDSFERGLYAGAIGWISSQESTFSVAIRSSLIQNGLLHAFAGTGIVDGSDPKLEWLELNSKISHWAYL